MTVRLEDLLGGLARDAARTGRPAPTDPAATDPSASQDGPGRPEPTEPTPAPADGLGAVLAAGDALASAVGGPAWLARSVCLTYAAAVGAVRVAAWAVRNVRGGQAGQGGVPLQATGRNRSARQRKGTPR